MAPKTRPQAADQPPARPEVTQAVTAGVIRVCQEMDWAPLREVTFKTGRRADVLALDKQGQFHVFEVKSSKEDFQVDQKWQAYLEFCDYFSFAVPTDFPIEILPDDVGLMLCDAYGGHILRDPTPVPLHPARRKTQTLFFARLAALRFAKYLHLGANDL